MAGMRDFFFTRLLTPCSSFDTSICTLCLPVGYIYMLRLVPTVRLITYRQTCTKRSPFRERKNGLIKQETSKRFNSYEIFYHRTNLNNTAPSIGTFAGRGLERS
jgi:hypothetical protein